MKAIVRMYGGKWKMASWIVAHLPRHRIYVEPFGGSAAVLLCKPPARVEVYNDIDGEVVNFFRVLRERPDELIRRIALTPYGRAEAEAAREPSGERVDEVERARRFLVRSWMTIGGPSTRWRSGFRYRRSASMATLLRWWTDLPERLAVAAERLRGVLIENRDYRDILDAFDGPETLFYVDPPYPPDTRSRQWRHGGYRHEFDRNDHEELLERILGLQGRVVLSTYPNSLYETLLKPAGWTSVRRGTVNGNGRPTVEVLWLSPDPERRRQLSLF